nr:MAG TPA: hypothetical protein [Caudoviricetes sp.]
MKSPDFIYHTPGLMVRQGVMGYRQMVRHKVSI